jgi:hypothetical protein
MAFDPRYKQSLLKAIQREWEALMLVTSRLTPEQMVAPDAGGWSPKDNLAHLAEWLKVLLGYHLDQRPAHEVLGVPLTVVKDWDFAVINPVLFERNKTRSTAEVLADLKSTYAQVVGRLNAMSLEALMQPRHPEDSEQRPLVLWVLGDTTEHFAEHRASIEKVLAGR